MFGWLVFAGVLHPARVAATICAKDNLCPVSTQWLTYQERHTVLLPPKHLWPKLFNTYYHYLQTLNHKALSRQNDNVLYMLLVVVVVLSGF